MARKARIISPGSPMYVTAFGKKELKIFAADEMKLNFLAWLRDAAKTYQLNIHAYSILPNHFEMLASPMDTMSLARTMQSLCRRFTQKYNQNHSRSGSVWQGRFHSSTIDSDQEILLKQAMIELSCVREGLISQPENYQWSSYPIHIGQAANYGLTDLLPFWQLGNTPFERQQNWRNWTSELGQLKGLQR